MGGAKLLWSLAGAKSWGSLVRVKRVLIFLAVGAIVGTVLASIVGPPLYAWYNTPTVPLPPGYDLDGTIRKVISDFRIIQLVGAFIGGAIAVALGVVLLRAQKKRAAELSAGDVGEKKLAVPKAPEAASSDRPM